jgi:hypothetical protein
MVVHDSATVDDTSSIAGPRALGREVIEPKAMHDEWLAQVEDRAEQLLHNTPRDHEEFDIVAWFAMEVHEDASRLTECWYG